MMNIIPNVVHVASLKVLTAVFWLMEEKITLPVWHSNAALQQPNKIYNVVCMVLLLIPMTYLPTI